jgi:hypothetical protein
MPGAAFTVSVAADVGSLPHSVVKTARYWLPLCDETAVKLSVVPVSPERSLQFDPLLVLTCHWTVGVGVPLAAAVNVAVAPEQTVVFDGLVVMLNPLLIVNVAAVVVLLPQLWAKTALYWLPLSAAAAVNDRLVAVSPLMSLQPAPLLVLTCHCTVGEPLAAALNVTVAPAHAVWFVGFDVMTETSVTVRVATEVVAVLHVLVKIARY